MPRIPQQAQTEGSTTFDPDKYFEAWSNDEYTPPYDNDFRKFILRTFGLPLRDEEYVYKASSEVSLLQVQTYLEFGGQGGLHAWYKDEEGQTVSPVLLRELRKSSICAWTSLTHAETPAERNGHRRLHGHLPADDEHDESPDSARLEREAGLDPRRRGQAPPITVPTPWAGEEVGGEQGEEAREPVL